MPRQPEILVFMPSLRGGGAERSTVRLIAGLAERQTGVALVVGQGDGSLSTAVPAGIEVIDLGVPRMRSAVLPLARLLRDRRPDALLCVMVHANVAGVLAARLARSTTRVVVTERSTRSEAAKLRQTPSARLLDLVLGPVYRRADRVVAVSHGVRRDLLERFGVPGKKVEVIHNPVVTPDLSEMAAEEPRHPWMSDGGPPVIVAAGRLVEAKDYPTLLEAFAELRQHRPARLLILGEGPLRAELAHLAEVLHLGDDVLDMPGFIDNPYPIVARAGVFALSSRYEGMPNALVEAAALGTTVVSTDCPSGPRELLGDEADSRLAPVGDASALAQLLLRALEKPQPVSKDLLGPFALSHAVDAYLRALLGVPANA